MRMQALTWKWPASECSLFADGSLNDWRGPDPRPDEAAIVQAEAEYAVVAADVEADHDIQQSFEADKIKRLLFEIEFNQEIRLRALEGKLVITKAQYRTALLNIRKTL